MKSLCMFAVLIALIQCQLAGADAGPGVRGSLEVPDISSLKPGDYFSYSDHTMASKSSSCANCTCVRHIETDAKNGIIMMEVRADVAVVFSGGKTFINHNPARNDCDRGVVNTYQCKTSKNGQVTCDSPVLYYEPYDNGLAIVSYKVHETLTMLPSGNFLVDQAWGFIGCRSGGYSCANPVYISPPHEDLSRFVPLSEVIP